MRELGLLSGSDMASLVQAEVAFDEVVPKFLIDGEQFITDEVTRPAALYNYALSLSTGRSCFRMTKEMRENMINYMSRDLAWDVFVHPGKYPLWDQMLRLHADVEVVVRQPVDA